MFEKVEELKKHTRWINDIQHFNQANAQQMRVKSKNKSGKVLKETKSANIGIGCWQNACLGFESM